MDPKQYRMTEFKIQNVLVIGQFEFRYCLELRFSSLELPSFGLKPKEAHHNLLILPALSIKQWIKLLKFKEMIDIICRLLHGKF